MEVTSSDLTLSITPPDGGHTRGGGIRVGGGGLVGSGWWGTGWLRWREWGGERGVVVSG